MVVFNDLRLSDDKKSLCVDCAIENLSIYSNMYISEIYVEYYKNVETSGDPSAKAVRIYHNTGNDSTVKAVHACLSESALPENFGTPKLAGGLYYVFVICGGTPSAEVASCLPCSYDNDTEIGIVPDWELLYEIGLKYIMNVAGSCFDKCNDDAAFMHFILLWNSLKMAMSTCEYSIIEKIWDMIQRTYRLDGSTMVVSGCGCGN